LDFIYPGLCHQKKRTGFHPGITRFLKFCDQQGLAKLREAVENEAHPALKKNNRILRFNKILHSFGLNGKYFQDWTRLIKMWK